MTCILGPARIYDWVVCVLYVETTGYFSRVWIFVLFWIISFSEKTWLLKMKGFGFQYYNHCYFLKSYFEKSKNPLSYQSVSPAMEASECVWDETSGITSVSCCLTIKATVDTTCGNYSRFRLSLCIKDLKNSDILMPSNFISQNLSGGPWTKMAE